jgi:endonuclease YncB( thermonuclease family)
MSAFRVISIIDGDTFEVSPQWKWNGQAGTRVRPTGYNAPELHTYGGQAAKEKLSRLIFGEEVELGTAYRVDRGRLVCDVYYKGKYLADYFPEYQ